MTAEDLLAAQKARFAEVDRLVPAPHAVPDGETLTAATAAGEQVQGVVQTRSHTPGTLDLLWSARRVWQLFPFPGETGTSGMDALLRAWRHRMDAESPGPDSSCAVTWPSRDAPAIRAFLDHGMVPISVLAVRLAPPPPPPRPHDLTLRRARPEDFEEVLALSLETVTYSALVAFHGRENARELLTPQLERNLAAGGPIWLAELDGVAVAAADCGWIESAPGLWAAELLPAGRWGYVNSVATRPGARSRGIGQALMAAVHRDFDALGAVGTYLYYNPPNPLSSVFWPRQGYRPLWTFWEAQPASALR